MRSSDFSDAERAALYRAIELRRDVRAEFVDTPVDDAVLERVLGAAHRAPSVGLSQPWRFVIVRDRATRLAALGAFDRANEAAAAGYDDASVASDYRELRLSGLLDAPLNICVTCDDDPARGRGLGRQTMPEMARYSTVCAIENLWLAARVEGLGVGWVSIVEPAEIRALLDIPERIAIVAYLCVGYVSTFATVADLERDRWESRAKLVDVIDYERYGSSIANAEEIREAN